MQHNILNNSHPPSTLNTQPLILLADVFRTGTPSLPPDLPRAADLCEQAIARDANPNAHALLAEILTDPRLPPTAPLKPDPIRAVILWETAANHGHQLATSRLASVYETGLAGVPPDRPRSAALYAKIVHLPRFKHFRFNLAWLLSSGLPPDLQDPSKAANLYAAIVTEEGDANAMFNLACVLSQGSDEMPQDNLRAASLYERAIHEASHVCSMHNLGVLLSASESGVPRDVPRAISLLESAVDHGRREANFDLALVLANDEEDDTPVDFPRALERYRVVLTELEHMGAMINLAEVLWEGKHGVEKDSNKAMRLWEMAIAQGIGYDTGDLEWLGIKLDAGYTPLDDSEAVQMREHATAQGWHLIAMCNLAEMLLSDVVPRDAERAMKLYKKALKDPLLAEVCETQEIDFDDTFRVVRDMLEPEGGREQWLDYAIEIYKLLAEGAANSHAMFLLGNIYIAMGDKDGGIDMYRRAIRLDNVDAMLTLAEIVLTGAHGINKNVNYSIDLLARILSYEEHDSPVTHAAQAATVHLALLWTGTG